MTIHLKKCIIFHEFNEAKCNTLNTKLKHNKIDGRSGEKCNDFHDKIKNRIEFDQERRGCNAEVGETY